MCERKIKECSGQKKLIAAVRWGKDGTGRDQRKVKHKKEESRAGVREGCMNQTMKKESDKNIGTNSGSWKGGKEERNRKKIKDWQNGSRRRK